MPSASTRARWTESPTARGSATAVLPSEIRTNGTASSRRSRVEQLIGVFSELVHSGEQVGEVLIPELGGDQVLDALPVRVGGRAFAQALVGQPELAAAPVGADGHLDQARVDEWRDLA